VEVARRYVQTLEELGSSAEVLGIARQVLAKVEAEEPVRAEAPQPDPRVTQMPTHMHEQFVSNTSPPQPDSPPAEEMCGIVELPMWKAPGWDAIKAHTVGEPAPTAEPPKPDELEAEVVRLLNELRVKLGARVVDLPPEAAEVLHRNLWRLYE
jgi:hypothetical protein